MNLSNKAYDNLKWVAQYLLPGLGTLYFALSAIWGLPYGEQVVGTITAVDTFIGVCLGISTSQYKKSDMFGDGDLIVENGKYHLDLNEGFEACAEKDTVTFRVVKK